MNELGKEKIPFLFIIDYNCNAPIILPLDKVDPASILFHINGFSNSYEIYSPEEKTRIQKNPLPYNTFLKSFDNVQRHLHYGNSYLTNLTFETEIEINLTLKEIFFCSHARYKLWVKDSFVIFSPEIFVQIDENGVISSFPMKGTIDATIENAEMKILNDKKEYAEHSTIVDLIRNDLSMVAQEVYVKRFRYIDRIETSEKPLLQVSSEICGKLPPNFHEKTGTILAALLPAGSISGAPKQKTLEIIAESENYKRGYYTGIFGYYDGKKLDSGVMIRFIEKRDEKYYYKSGGGITIYSEAEKEYQEVIDKIYVPVA